MKTEAEWEARARELFSLECGEGWKMTTSYAARLALQLGREMAEEARIDGLHARLAVDRQSAQREQAAADERAEEIARLCLKGVPTGNDLGGYGEYGQGHTHGRQEAAAIARSTITKPKEPPTWTMEEAMREPVKDEAAIRADEREKIANLMIRALSKPKTRERVLEEALREILSRNQRCGGSTGARPECRCDYVGCIARRALEWKP